MNDSPSTIASKTRHLSVGTQVLNQAYRPEIDGLRAIAVVAVILFHAGFSGVSGGYVGVDIFFVISGYLITGIISREIGQGYFSISKFYERRIRRIFPALFLMMATTFTVGALILTPQEYMYLAKESLSASLFSSNILFWRDSGYFDAEAATRPLLHTWSLAVEEQFYIFFPPALWAAYRLFPKKICLVVSAIGLLSLVVSVYAVSHHPTAAFYLLPPRAWELMAGALVALIPGFQNRTGGSILAAAGLIAILLPIIRYTEGTPFPGVAALLPVLGTAAVIYSQNGGKVHRLLSTPPFSFVGKVSYSLYLWHWPVLVYLHMALGPEPSSSVIVFALAAIFGISYLSWKYIETPFRHVHNKTTVWRTGILVMSGAIALSVTTLGLGGMPERLPGDVLRELNYAEKQSADLEKGYSCAERFAGSNYGPCEIGRPGDKADLVVLGDSHAMSLKSIFDEVFIEKGITGKLISVPGCPPLFDMQRINYEIDCRKELVAAKQFISQYKPKGVILVGAWRGVLFSKDTEFEGSESFDNGTRLKNIENAMTQTIAYFHKDQIVVGALMPIPGSKIAVPTSPIRAFADVTFDISEYRSDFSGLDAAMKRSSVDIVGYPEDQFCTPECQIFGADGLPLYFDDSHVTDVGDDFAKPAIVNVADKLLNR